MTKISPELKELFARAGKAGISNPRLAANADISNSTLHRWERGKSKPTRAMLRLVEASLADLLSR